jgi:hypothetical protein
MATANILASRSNSATPTPDSARTETRPPVAPELPPAAPEVAAEFCRREVWWEPLAETGAVDRELATLLLTEERPVPWGRDPVWHVWHVWHCWQGLIESPELPEHLAGDSLAEHIAPLLVRALQGVQP